MRFAVLDTETTGFFDDPDARVVEVGIAVFDHTVDSPDVPIRTFSSFVCPDVLTETGRAVLLQISHIDPDAVLAAPSAEEVWRAIVDFLLDADGLLPVRIYNEQFDSPMMARSFPGWSQISLGPPCGPQLDWRLTPACIMEGFSARFEAYSRTMDDGRKGFFALSNAVRLAGLLWEGDAHRALTDAVMAGRLALRLDLDAFVMPTEHPGNLQTFSAKPPADLPIVTGPAAEAPMIPAGPGATAPMIAAGPGAVAPTFGARIGARITSSATITEAPLPMIAMRRRR